MNGKSTFLTTMLLGGSLLATVSHAQWIMKSNTGPEARYQGAMVYDSARRVHVLFGGANVFGLKGDTWEWNGTVWSPKSPTDSPPARSVAGVTFDTLRKRVIIFGGYDGPDMADTWSYDGTNWTQLAAGGPPPRRGPSISYDPVRDRVVMFGGQQGGTSLNDTWEWDGTSWTQKFPSGLLPPPRAYSTMVYDADHQRTLMFCGGNDQSNTFLNDTWAWDGTKWRQITSGELPARWTAAGVYDTNRKRAVVFSGRDFLYAEGPMGQNMWEFDGNQWFFKYLASGPGTRNGAAMSYDSVRKVIVLYGGEVTANAHNFQGDTWEFASPAIQPTASITPSIIVSGNPGSATIYLSRPAGTDGQIVKLSSGSTSLIVPPTVFFPSGQNQLSIPIKVGVVSSAQVVRLYATVDDRTDEGTVQVIPAGLKSLTYSSNSVKGGKTATGIVTLNGGAPTGGATVALTSDSPGITFPASVFIKESAVNATFLVQTPTVTQNTIVTIKATYNGVERSGSLTIKP